MLTFGELSVVSTDTIQGRALVVFSDGVIAIYSASLLRTFLYQAEKVEDKDRDDEDDTSFF
ncbi:MAG TPA: hypothetical protein VGD62_00890 [Acidobacteriaceae bacterium]